MLMVKKGDKQVFSLNIVGVDATSDVAICGFAEDNKNIPVFGKSKTVKFADSRKEKEGNNCFTIGDPLDADSSSVSNGIIRDPKFMGVKGVFINELLVTTLDVFPSTSGSAVYNCKGNVIGIISFDYSTPNPANPNDKQLTPGFCGGLSSHMMYPIVTNLIKDVQSSKLAHIRGPPYYTYRKGYLEDISWVGITPLTLVNLYPNNYKDLYLRGIVITAINSDYNVLTKPVSGLPINVGDIITAVQSPCGNFVKIGTHSDEFAI